MFDKTFEALSRNSGLLVMRLMFGGLMLLGHGMGKAQNLFAGEFGTMNPIGLGPEVSFILITFAEFICATLIIIGLATRFAAIPLTIGMLVAAFVAHTSDPLFANSIRWVTVDGQEIAMKTAAGFNSLKTSAKELPLLYAGAFATLIFTGGGAFSADRYAAPFFKRLRENRKKAKAEADKKG